MISLANAKKGDEYYTKDGRVAVFIARDSLLARPYIFRLGDQVITRLCNGKIGQIDLPDHPSIVRKKNDH